MRPAVLFAAVALAASCGFRNVERVPPQEADTEKPYSTMDIDQLHTRMRALAGHAAKINEILRKAELTQADRDSVVQEITAMEAITNELSPEDARTVHPVLWKNIDRFQADVRKAKEQATGENPNFYLAGTIAGSCGYCHGPGHGKVH